MSEHSLGDIERIREDESRMLRISAMGELCFVRFDGGAFVAAQYNSEMDLNRMQEVPQKAVESWIGSDAAEVDVRDLKPGRFEVHEPIAGVAVIGEDGDVEVKTP